MSEKTEGGSEMKGEVSKPTQRFALSGIAIEGFKSIRERRVMPLTALNVVAGANSSGKSSFMQPLLLLKQTLEAAYDPGPLLINGPNVQFTELEQFFSKPYDSENFEKLDFHALFQESFFFEIGVNKKERILFIGPSINIEKVDIQQLALGLIHVPGLRGQPDRRYKKTSAGDKFPGRIDDYVASIISDWQDKKDDRLHKLSEYLIQMGLTSAVKANRIDASSIEIKVGRLPATQPSNPEDLVSIADVGFGVSQVLPVLVALLTGKDGQLVYIEQPEIHLHPKAQRALAHIFVDSIQRGAKVIVETHSSLFLREIQTLVAQGKADKDSINLHWVTRNQDGDTDIQTCKMDESGAYGDWPQDFDETEMQSATDYYTAAEARLFENK